MSAEISTDVARAARWLREGRLVAFATETVYGLGADALNVPAVARVFEAKGRPRFDPLIVHLAEMDEVESLAREFSDLARKLAETFWPGPLTLVLPKRDVVPDLVTAGLPNVALRIPAHEQARELLRAAGRPIAAPSANPFGRISPTTAEHVLEQLGERIDLILDGGPCRVGVESTVIDLTGAQPVLLRPGGVTLEDLQNVLGTKLETGTPVLENGVAAVSPGMLPQHYAPVTPVSLIEDWSEIPADARGALLAFTTPPTREMERGFIAVEILSPTGDLCEAAAGFFAALRRLDASGAACIYAKRFPTEGLGLALNDRLQRASRRSGS